MVLPGALLHSHRSKCNGKPPFSNGSHASQICSCLNLIEDEAVQRGLAQPRDPIWASMSQFERDLYEITRISVIFELIVRFE